MQTKFEIGDRVRLKREVMALTMGQFYTVREIRRGIDGAYDWDDIFIKGHDKSFCEFDFELVLPYS